MSLFGKLDYTEFATILRNAVASFGKVNPVSGWDELKMSELDIDQTGTTFTSKNGRGKAIVVENGDELMVAFRGTDKFNDLYDYDNISMSKNYFKQFEPLLKKIANYVDDTDIHVTFTGISLGGAVVNLVAGNSRKLWDGALKDATFVGISSPYLSGDGKADIYNFGFNNDPIYHISPGSWNSAEKANATNHIWVYNNHKYLQGDNIDDRLSMHGVGHLNDAMKALYGLALEDGELLVDVLKPHSYVVFDDTRGVLKAGNVHHPWGTELSVIGSHNKDRMDGASVNKAGSNVEWFFGRGGNDVIKGHGGADQLYGGNGKDTLIGGAGADFASGGAGNDKIWLENSNDRAEGGTGADKFMVSDMFALNGSGNPAPFGKVAAQLRIEDFEQGTDRLNLHAIDANVTIKGHQPLFYAGYYTYETDSAADMAALEKGRVIDDDPGSVTVFEDKFGDTLVLINTDSDSRAEIEITLSGSVGDIYYDLFL